MHYETGSVVPIPTNGEPIYTQIGLPSDYGHYYIYITVEVVDPYEEDTVITPLKELTMNEQTGGYYIDDFTIEESSDATLSGLTLSSGELSPSFTSATTSYTAIVENSVNSITLTPTVTESHATVKVNNTAVTSGSISGTIDLSVDENTINIEVTAENDTTKTYTVTVTREEDITPPTLTSGAAIRTSDTEGTVNFTSDEEESYYYAVVTQGAVATIDTLGSGIACTTSETSITLSNMTAGAKDVYIVVKDAAGNVSSESFMITLDAYEEGGGEEGGGEEEIDTIAPTLTSGGENRTSNSNGTVKFTSDEEGRYYYEVVASGSTKPNINTSGTGTACTTSETTITLSNMTAGAKDVYIVVKDAAGNVSSNSLKITIAAYVTPTEPQESDDSDDPKYSISIDFGNINFTYSPTTQNENGWTVNNIFIEDKIIKDSLEKSVNNAVLSIPVKNNTNEVVAQ